MTRPLPSTCRVVLATELDAAGLNALGRDEGDDPPRRHDALRQPDRRLGVTQ